LFTHSINVKHCNKQTSENNLNSCRGERRRRSNTRVWECVRACVCVYVWACVCVRAWVWCSCVCLKSDCEVEREFSFATNSSSLETWSKNSQLKSFSVCFDKQIIWGVKPAYCDYSWCCQMLIIVINLDQGFLTFFPLWTPKSRRNFHGPLNCQ